MITFRKNINILDDWFGESESAKIELDQNRIHRIIDLSKAVRELGVFKIVEFDSTTPLEFFIGNESLKESDTGYETIKLNICDNMFYWSGHVTNTTIEFETDPISINLIKELSRIEECPEENLPTLLHDIKTDKAINYLEEKLKGNQNEKTCVY